MPRAAAPVLALLAVAAGCMVAGGWAGAAW